MAKLNRSLVVSVRLAPDTRTKFYSLAQKTGGATSTLREIIRAYVDGRFTVIPPSTEGTIYHVNRE